MRTDEERSGQPSEFQTQLYWLVVEASRLFEFLQGATEPDGDGGPVTHGPWDPAECSRQLLAWFDAGLIELFADPPDDVPRPRNAEEWRVWNGGEHLRWLDPVAARQLLSEPHRWTFESDDALVCVVRTDAGMEVTAPFL
ncbi:hypothetical protein [Blastococcus haudaquaticus]|uniref:hypothetical protein n=1 Tax=Blastococcus haudaquaticus TaxID=1938745 RepID=UPI000BE431DF|nr:hypothetical protein [Blastococcus haudaquaticus]